MQGGSTTLGRLRLSLSNLAQATGELTLSAEPHFLWVTEFPLFTRADADKEFLAHGRWSSSHHPFTAPMWEDIDKMYGGRISEVRILNVADVTLTLTVLALIELIDRVFVLLLFSTLVSDAIPS